MAKEISKPLAFGIIGVIAVAASGFGYYMTTRTSAPPTRDAAQKQEIMKKMQEMQAKMGGAGNMPGMPPGMGPGGMPPGMGPGMQPGMPGMGPGGPGMQPGMPSMGPGGPMSGPGAPPVPGSVDGPGGAKMPANMPPGMKQMPSNMQLPPGVDLNKPPVRVDPSKPQHAVTGPPDKQ